MTEFSTSAVLEVSVDQQSLRSTSDTIESELPDPSVGVTASGQLGRENGGRASQMLTDGGDFTSDLLEVNSDQLDVLEDIEEKAARGAFAGGGGGFLGGVLDLGEVSASALIAKGATITASALIATAATVTAGALIAGGAKIAADELIASKGNIDATNLIASGASISAGALIASSATVTNSALIATAASVTPAALVATAATIPAAALIAGAATISAGVLIAQSAEVTAAALIGATATIAAGALIGSTAVVTAGALVGSAAVITAGDLIARKVFGDPSTRDQTTSTKETEANFPSTVTIDGKEFQVPGEIPENITSGGKFGLTQEAILEAVRNRQQEQNGKTSITSSREQPFNNNQQVTVNVENRIESEVNISNERELQQFLKNPARFIERALGFNNTRGP